MRILVALFLVLVADSVTAQPAPDYGTERVAIWAAVVQAVYPPQFGVRVSATTINMARAPRAMSEWVARQTADDTVAVRDMLARNAQPTPIDSAALDALQRDGERVCGMSLTHPGMNSRGDVAFVYGQFGCGLGSAWDEGFSLERRGGAWIIVARRRYAVE